MMVLPARRKLALALAQVQHMVLVQVHRMVLVQVLLVHHMVLLLPQALGMDLEEGMALDLLLELAPLAQERDQRLLCITLALVMAQVMVLGRVLLVVGMALALVLGKALVGMALAQVLIQVLGMVLVLVHRKAQGKVGEIHDNLPYQ